MRASSVAYDFAEQLDGMHAALEVSIRGIDRHVCRARSLAQQAADSGNHLRNEVGFIRDTVIRQHNQTRNQLIRDNSLVIDLLNQRGAEPDGAEDDPPATTSRVDELAADVNQRLGIMSQESGMATGVLRAKLDSMSLSSITATIVIRQKLDKMAAKIDRPSGRGAANPTTPRNTGFVTPGGSKRQRVADSDGEDEAWGDYVGAAASCMELMRPSSLASEYERDCLMCDVGYLLWGHKARQQMKKFFQGGFAQLGQWYYFRHVADGGKHTPHSSCIYPQHMSSCTRVRLGEGSHYTYERVPIQQQESAA